MRRLIVVHGAYKPNTAPVNRLLSMLHGFDELDVDVEMVFVYPNSEGDRLDPSRFKHVHVVNLWDGHRLNNKWIKYLRSFWDAQQYARQLKPGCKVLLFGSSEYLSIFVGRKGAKVFQERTEHFDVVKQQPALLQRCYLNAIPRLDGMFVISTTLSKEYMKAGAKNVVIVNMTVDANRFVGLTRDPQKENYIAYCGTASNNKDGVDDLIKAFSIVRNNNHDVKLYIIGKTPSRNDEAGNLALIHRLGLDDAIVFKGVISAEDMPLMLKNAKVLALARPDSLQARCGFPTKLGEYLLTENPVVVTRVGDIPLFLEDGKTALLAEQRNPEDFAAKLLWALEHPKEAAVIGKAGAEVALREFNYKIEASKIVNAIFRD